MGWRVGAGAFAIVLGSYGVVHAEPSVCRAATERSISEIAARQLEPEGTPMIGIEVGETLCLETAPRGHLLDVRLVSESPTAVQVSLRRAKGRTVLAVRNPGSSPLWFSTEPRGESRRAPPHDTAYVILDEKARFVLLSGFGTEPEPPRMRRGEAVTAPPYDPEAERARRTHAFWLGVFGDAAIYHQAHRDLGRSLAANGYQLDSTFLVAGFGFELGLGRWRAGLGADCFGRSKVASSRSLRARADSMAAPCFASVYGGVNALEVRGFLLTPLVGIGGGSMTLYYDPAEPPLLEDQLLQRAGGHHLVKGYGAATVAIALEQRTKLRKDGGLLAMLGVRIGYLEQLSDGEWRRENDAGEMVALSGGPRLQASGPFVRFRVGVAVGRAGDQGE